MLAHAANQLYVVEGDNFPSLECGSVDKTTKNLLLYHPKRSPSIFVAIPLGDHTAAVCFHNSLLYTNLYGRTTSPDIWRLGHGGYKWCNSKMVQPIL